MRCRKSIRARSTGADACTMEGIMAKKSEEGVYRIVDVVGVSETSWEDAGRLGLLPRRPDRLPAPLAWRPARHSGCGTGGAAAVDRTVRLAHGAHREGEFLLHVGARRNRRNGSDRQSIRRCGWP